MIVYGRIGAHPMGRILLTGGAGFIGSHTAVALAEAGYSVTVLDDLSNGHRLALARAQDICSGDIRLVVGDVRDYNTVRTIFEGDHFASVIHLAGLKSISDSVDRPLAYFDSNIAGSIALCRAMSDSGIFRLIFSSSATVYGRPRSTPIAESHPVGDATNPYGHSKAIVEKLLGDVSRCDPRWSIGILRYFNPIGAHPSGKIGEQPRGEAANLLPVICDVLNGKRPYLHILGDQFPTGDGTGVRDYIHVCDLAFGHVAALSWTLSNQGLGIWNLGTGRGHSVLEIVSRFEKIAARTIPYRIGPPREGDVAECVADPSKAAMELNWRAVRTMDDMLSDLWAWQLRNPNGYNT